MHTISNYPWFLSTHGTRNPLYHAPSFSLSIKEETGFVKASESDTF